MSLRVGLDLDGVVADWITSATGILRSKGSNIPYEDPPYWDWLKDHSTPEAWKFLWGPGMKASYQFAQPYPGAVQFAKELRKLADVVILTSRPEGSWGVTIQWWLDHMCYTPAGFNFFRDGSLKGAVSTNCMIEDNVDYAIAYGDAQDDAQVFLLDRPWNKSYNVNMQWNLTRAGGYDELLNMIERLKNEDTV